MISANILMQTCLYVASEKTFLTEHASHLPDNINIVTSHAEHTYVIFEN